MAYITVSAVLGHNPWPHTSMYWPANSRFISTASFDPQHFKASLLGSPRLIQCAPPCFNPSLVEISSLMRDSAAEAGIVGARYLAAIRETRGAQCQELRDNRRQLEPTNESTLRLSVKNFRSYLALLDSSLRQVAFIVNRAGELKDVGLVDVRLDRFGESLLMHGMMYRAGRDPTWVVKSFDLSFEGALVHLVAGRVHPDLKVLSHAGHWKNLGILWNGDYGSPLRILYWLKEIPDVRRGLPPPAPSKASQRAQPLYGLGGRRRVSNNGSPLLLNRPPGFRLASGHVHADELPHGRNEHGTTTFGNTYINYFYLMRDKPPYEIIASSPPFCFPSADNASSCDTIQFITSLIKLEETNQVLISYGINDCIGATVKLNLDAVVAFTTRRSTALPLAHQVRRTLKIFRIRN
jgi:hypothetical protein